jgi:hypothetical protein
MRIGAYERQQSGIDLLRIANGFKKYRPELSDQTAFKLAMLGNPDLGETYSGFAIRRDAVEQVKSFVFNGGDFPEVGY